MLKPDSLFSDRQKEFCLSEKLIRTNLSHLLFGHTLCVCLTTFPETIFVVYFSLDPGIDDGDAVKYEKEGEKLSSLPSHNTMTNLVYVIYFIIHILK